MNNTETQQVGFMDRPKTDVSAGTDNTIAAADFVVAQSCDQIWKFL
jgi:hypothetical protein